MHRFASAFVSVFAAAIVLAVPSSVSAQTYVWSGFYIGASVGGGVSTPDFFADEVGSHYNNERIEGPTSGGFHLAGQVGWDTQLGHNLVAGGQFRIGMSGFSGEGFAGPGDDTRGRTEGGLEWSVTGRVGYEIYGILPYFKIGALGVSTDVEVLDDCTTSPCGPLLLHATDKGSATEFVWAIGAEIPLKTKMMGHRWSVGAEWMFSDFRVLADATGSATTVGGAAAGGYTWGFQTHYPKGVISAHLNMYLGK